LSLYRSLNCLCTGALIVFAPEPLDVTERLPDGALVDCTNTDDVEMNRRCLSSLRDEPGLKPRAHDAVLKLNGECEQSAYERSFALHDTERDGDVLRRTRTATEMRSRWHPTLGRLAMFFAGFERCRCLMAKSNDEPIRDVPRRIQTATDKRWSLR